MGTVAACGFGGVLYKVITSTTVLNLPEALISKAFYLRSSGRLHGTAAPQVRNGPGASEGGERTDDG